MAFHTLGLTDKLVQGILATGYNAPTEIQSQAIPIALEGKDVIGIAQTGTGKTAAFVLPILQRLSTYDALGHKGPKIEHRTPKALIVTPTRELALQVDESIKNYGRFLRSKSLPVYGGVNIEPQFRALKKGVDIIVATPGRLLDHVQRRSADLSKIEFIVLDEADRMLDMGFLPDVKRIISLIPKERQTMMFSATMSKEIQTLTHSFQQHPKLIQVGEQRNPVQTVTQNFYSCQHELKMDLLLHILKTEDLHSVLVFSRTRHGAEKIAKKLERNGIKSSAIHSDRSQNQRQRALEGFKRGQYNVLVATDIASRGIDVEGISHVINFEVPNFPEDYIHRMGRRARAGATGSSLSFVTSSDRDKWNAIERLLDPTKKKENFFALPNRPFFSLF